MAADVTDEQSDPSLAAGNMSIAANTSEIAYKQKCDSREQIYKFGFNLSDLYKISLVFYKKEKESIHFTYADKLNLVAYWKQVSCGKYDEGKFPEIGYFDVIGNDRRKAWEALADMAPDVAKQKFCEILEKQSPTYKEFIDLKKKESDSEREKEQKLEEEERLCKEAEEKRRQEEEEQRKHEAAEQERLSQETERLRIKLEEDAAAAARKEDFTSIEEENALLTQSSPNLVSPAANGLSSGHKIGSASLWTRPKLQEFITHVKRDASSVIVVGRGETVTIRVPTNEHGSCIFWEFATDTYDVGFGVFFEWSRPRQVLNIDKSDQRELSERVVNDSEQNAEVNTPEQDEVLPVLRRNSHEEVIVGSHVYPGQGVYLLKFDNSYSLLRSKTLYYRVYYTR